MGLTRQPTQDELLEDLHYKYINLVAESGIPIWYLNLYYSYHYYPYEEVNRNRNSIIINTNQDEAHQLPF